MLKRLNFKHHLAKGGWLVGCRNLQQQQQRNKILLCGGKKPRFICFIDS